MIWDWIEKNRLLICMSIVTPIFIFSEARQKVEIERQLQSLQTEMHQLRSLRPLRLLLDSLEDSDIRLSWDIRLAQPQELALQVPEGSIGVESSGTHAISTPQALSAPR